MHKLIYLPCKMHRFVLVLICLAVLYPTRRTIDLQFRNFTSLSEALQDAERFILKFNETHNFPSLVFGLSVKGKTVFRKAWGMAELENDVPARETTKYRIASISKTFVSAIIGQLVDQGRIHYDDSLSEYLDEHTFPAKQWAGKSVNITIRQLLSHTAGTHITDVTKDFNQIESIHNVTQMLHQFKDEPLRFEPGSRFEYSNYGFQLLGAVIESVTGQTCQLVMSEFMLKNGLNSSYVGSPSVLLHEIAHFYSSPSANEPKKNIPSGIVDQMLFLQGYWPAGGVISTVADLTRFGQLLIDSYKARKNAILSQKTLKKMWTPIAQNLSIPMYLNSQYGLGWFVAVDNPKLAHQNVIWHAGGMLGVTTILVIYPEEEIVAVALTNKGQVLQLDQMVVYTVENVYRLVQG